MRRLWAWLLAKPKPRKPAPRIVTIGVSAFCIGVYALVSALPARAAIRVVDIMLAVCFSVAFLVVAYLAARAALSRRRRTR